MLYMVEMDLPHPSLLDEWHRWYNEHLRMLLSIPGILSAQRFQSIAPGASPFVAIYTIAGADVMTSPAYRAKAGPKSPGRWSELMTNWYRNVLDGLERAPEVPRGGWLAIMDRRTASAPPLPEGFIALRPVALDCSIVERGLMFGREGSAPPAAREEKDCHLRSCKPITPLLKPGAATCLSPW
ncbi:MAG: hypothetical protein HYU44_18375 [Betaproteobacteria bacterium]|nr:hypothetical protein [Betaproteobacteria bacterium]